MSVFLSPVGNGDHWLGANALPANAGFINTYLAGTTTPAATYTTSAGNIANTNPIVLSAAGIPPLEIWLTGGTSYKFIITDILGVQIGPPYDNIYGIGDPSIGGTAPATSIAYTPPGAGAVATTVQAKEAQWRSVFDFMTAAQITDCQSGAMTLDLTTAVQAALTAIGVTGGILYFPPGTFMINQTVKISSSTIVQGSGKATLIKANPTYVGLNTGAYSTQTCHMMGNVNYGATVLTDHDIVIRDLAFDWGSVTISGGGAFSISMHFVSNITIDNVSSNSGDNVTALLSCLDTLTFNCHGTNCRNAYFDDWGGASSIKVICCTGRTTSGTTSQGIQFTGLGSFSDPGTATNAVVAFCELYGIKNAGTASALIANANAAGSSTARYKTFGNYVENSDNGHVVQGVIGQAISVGDTFRNCTTGSPIFFNTDASGAPSNCRIFSPTLIDCSHPGGNIAMIVIQGTNNRVEQINVINTGAVAYTGIVWFPAAAVNCYAQIDKAQNGNTGLRVINQSPTSQSKDTDDLDAWPYGGASPTLVAANTIAPTLGVTIVSGTVTVKTITVPPGCLGGGQITLISSGSWVWDATGNIIIAGTPVNYRPIVFTWIPNNAKWFPSYVS
jgi:hypothetical protein